MARHIRDPAIVTAVMQVQSLTPELLHAMGLKKKKANPQKNTITHKLEWPVKKTTIVSKYVENVSTLLVGM